MVIPGPKLQDHTLPSPWTEFGASQLEDEDHQEDLGIHSLDSVFRSICKA